MDASQFQARVERMERLAQESPGAYRRQVFLLAALGFVSLGLIVLTLLALLAASLAMATRAVYVGGKLAVVIGALLWVVLRSLWVRLDPPKGEVITRAQAPRLFELLDRLQANLRTPPVHQVLVTPALNAGVTQIPRLGVFGWHRNYLLLGLPLLRSLSVPQLEAVLAHELGHLSRGHARMGNWIYRLRLSWARLEDELNRKPHWGSGAIRGYLRWYVPLFNASSYPLARRNEFEADATSAQLTSPQVAAQALTNVNVAHAFLQTRYWPQVHAQARAAPQPNFQPYTDYHAPSLDQIAPVDVQRWLSIALAESTTVSDSHPCLRERLSALGTEAQIVLPGAGEAADQLPGERSAALAKAFDAHWRSTIEPSWQKAHAEAQAALERVRALRGQEAQGPLPVAEALELADLEYGYGSGPVQALAMLHALVEREPQSLPARYQYARLLLLQSRAEGVPLMESVVEEAADAILPGSSLLADYFARSGDHEAAQSWRGRAEQRRQELAGAEHERSNVFPGDQWLAHGLEPDALRALIDRLSKVKGLQRAYLVRKQVRFLPQQPLYVLGFTTRRLGFPSSRAAQIMEEVRTQVQFPGETLILRLDSRNRRLSSEIRALKRAPIL